MRTLLLHKSTCCLVVGLLIGLNAAAQVPQPATDVALLNAASNALQATRITMVTNIPVRPAPAANAGAALTVPGAASAFSAGSASTTVVTNGVQTTVTRLQSQPLTAGRSLSSSAMQPNLRPLDSTPVCVRPGSGLVSWWRAESNASDATGINPGALVNGASFSDGKVGQAFLLDGSSQYVEIPYSTGLVSPGFTIETWVYPTSNIGWQSFIFGQSFGRQLVVQAGDDGFCWVAFYITDQDGNFIGLGSNSEIPVGGWTHIAASWDGSNLKLYINGQLDAQGVVWVSGLGDSGCPFSIGSAGSCDPDQYFPGLIDEVSLYNRALFAGEIHAIYQAGSAGKCTAPPVCVTCPTSAVSWWPADGDAWDVFGINPGIIQNGTGFTNGIVGQAFSFDGNSQSVQIPYSTNLVLSTFSLEVWANPSAQVDGQAWIWGQGYGRQLDVHPGIQGLNVAFYVNTDPWSWSEVDSSGEIPIGEWTHLVGTWDGTYLSLYVNGALDQQAAPGVVPWDSGCPFSIGGANDLCGGSGQYFPGLIDEATLYNTALTPDQVQALYNAGSAGKCALPPSILSQSPAITVIQGDSATLWVMAKGSSLSYQWYFNGVAISGATQATLSLANVQPANAGTYTVRISNSLNSVTSAGEVLMIEAGGGLQVFTPLK
jgi:Concanavalin A-like lectin/glucanases superfamily/Immunoglobulin domain